MSLSKLHCCLIKVNNIAANLVYISLFSWSKMTFQHHNYDLCIKSNLGRILGGYTSWIMFYWCTENSIHIKGKQRRARVSSWTTRGEDSACSELYSLTVTDASFSTPSAWVSFERFLCLQNKIYTFSGFFLVWSLVSLV